MLPSSSKESKKNLDDFLSVLRIRIRIRMFLGLPDPHAGPLDRGTDPSIWIRFQMRECHGSTTLVAAYLQYIFVL